MKYKVDNSNFKLSAGVSYQTDFSVTTRLLPSVGYGNNTSSSSTYSPLPQKQDAFLSGMQNPPGWQHPIPTDQTAKYNPSLQAPWQSAPNAYYPYPSESSLPPAQSKCYPGAVGHYGAGFDPTNVISKPRRLANSPGDVPLHHESTHYPPAIGYIQPVGAEIDNTHPQLVKEEASGSTPHKEGSNSSKFIVCIRMTHLFALLNPIKLTYSYISTYL